MHNIRMTTNAIINRDKRRKLYILADTETTGLKPVADGEFDPFQLVFDFAYKVVDKKKNVYFQRSYLVQEVFTNMKWMENAYYFSKYPEYIRKLATGEIILKPWAEIVREFHHIIQIANIDTFLAYNVDFDKRALNNTNITLFGSDWYRLKKLKSWDIYTFAVLTLGQQKTFRRQIEERKLFTKSGKFLSATAETMYRYISQNWDFIESHTALEDTEIELEIWYRCLQSHKSVPKVVPCPYRFVKRK